jgi:hypothetical protein
MLYVIKHARLNEPGFLCAKKDEMKFLLLVLAIHLLAELSANAARQRNRKREHVNKD